tara:strand:+ start:331 stop:732 length:402 start_codon:yes stop_codon:yes gene_type:complete
MTNWTTEQLKNLKEVTNHKIIYDGYEFVWMSKPDEVWTRHYINNFEDYNKPMYWIHHHTYNWNKEYKQRQEKYLSDMRKGLDIDVRIVEISRDTDTMVKEKVNQILELKPYMYNQDVADILGVTVRTVQRCKN